MNMPWNRKQKVNQKEIKLQNTNRKLQIENKKLGIMQKMLDSVSTQMRSFRSFPPEFYSTGIKQGPNAGALSGNNSLARRHSRMAMNISPVAGSLVSTINTLTVGHGLELEAQPVWRLIPGAPADAERPEWSKTTESKYHLWAKNKKVSHDESMNRFQQEQVIFERLLIDGEYFEVYRYSSNSLRNPMSIQLINAEDVRTPSGSVVSQDNTEEDGIEYNARGVAVAYHIYDHGKQQTIRVIKEGARSKRVFVNHTKLGSNRRGQGIIAPMITELMKLGDYEVLELQAAVVNALYALWVQTPVGEDGEPTLNTGITDADQTATPISAEAWLAERKEKNYNEGGLQIDALPGGYEIKSHDTGRPNVNFGNFMDQVKKNLFSSVNMPMSVIDKQFQNNYSASRGELILAWYEIDKYRFNQSMTNDLIYRMWIWGEIQRDKIKAPGFFDDPEIQDAWVNAKWIGNQRPDIDPKKSVEAHIMEQNRGYKTGKQITGERDGGDYDENLDRVAIELEKVAANQVPFTATEDVDLQDQ